MKKLFLLPAFFCIFIMKVQAQWIDQFHIFPPNPTTADNISMYYSASFPSSGCNLINYDLSISLGIIICNAYHEQGILTVICNSNQTFQLGYLNEGAYLLTLNLFIPNGSTSATLNFNVTGTVDINEQTQENMTSISPNPANSSVSIKSSVVFQNISIFNTSGQLVARIPYNTEIDLTGYTQGLYMLVFSSDEYCETKKLLINK